MPNLRRSFVRTLQAGEVYTYPVESFWRSIVVVAQPSPGASVLVEYRFAADLDYMPWAWGWVSESTEDAIHYQPYDFKISVLGGSAKIGIIS